MGNEGSRTTTWDIEEEFLQHGESLEGKVVIITGGYEGIGAETTLSVVRLGAHVILPGRSPGKIERIIERAKECAEEAGHGGTVEGAECDLSSQESVHRFIAWFKKTERPLHLLINNAGVMACKFERTVDELEPVMAVNHLGHFTLTRGLLPVLRASAPSRVVVVSSSAHAWGPLDVGNMNWERGKPYSYRQAYGQSKLCNLLFALELDRREQDKGVRVFAVNPGVIATSITRHLGKVIECLYASVSWMFCKTTEQGAATTMYCALLAEEGGKYYVDCAMGEPKAHVWEKGIGEQMWDRSVELVGE